MRSIFKPSAEECRIIRDCAQRVAERPRVRIDPALRVNVSLRDGEAMMNASLLGAPPDGSLEGTDFYDHADWMTFKKGFQLADGGRACVDFHVYEVGAHGELRTNVTAIWEKGVLVRVDEPARRRRGIWSRPETQS